MKNTIALLSLVLSADAFADERLVCTQYDRDADVLGQRTIVLAQTAGDAYEAELFDGAETYTETTHAGTVSVEDVSFSFQSTDGRVGFHLYLDEMSEASLTLDGQEAGDFVCHRATYVCQQYDRSTEKLLNRTVTLTETAGNAYDLELYDGAATYTEQVFPGTAEVEDVVFAFTSADGRATFGMYLDEAAESSLTLDGQDAGDFVCR